MWLDAHLFWDSPKTKEYCFLSIKNECIARFGTLPTRMELDIGILYQLCDVKRQILI